MKSLAPFIVMIAILVTIAIAIIALFNYKLKKQIVESGPLNDNSLKFLSMLPKIGSESLKWGIILFFGGLGLVVLEFVPYDADTSSLPYGVEAIFLAIGFLLYSFMSRRRNDHT